MAEARSEKTEAGEALGRPANGTGASARTAEIREKEGPRRMTEVSSACN
jgi:hypothetical protein